MAITQKIGFIGQGWIGKHYADDFEARGYEVVRYGLESAYAGNKDAIGECGIVFIAVPTPTTPERADTSIVEAVLPLVAPGAIAVIKSTIPPGTTVRLQDLFTDRVVLHAPEFLREAHAARDAAHPDRNLIGIPITSSEYHTHAESVLNVLPTAPYTRILSSTEAELVKYAGNVFLALKVVYANLLFDVTTANGADYTLVADALGADPRIGPSHLSVMSQSGHGGPAGRGAGGHCFIKDLEAFRRAYAEKVGDTEGNALLAAVVRKNAALLTASGKDLDLLAQVYGSDMVLP